MKFIDEVNITVTSGNGGPGCVSFRREAKVPRGGPDGGDGGKGGDVLFCTSSRLNTLLDLRLRSKYIAGHGQQGGGSQLTGANGNDIRINVPIGTVIKNSHGQTIADLNSEQEYQFLKGGIGGKGNTFYKSSINQAPEKAQKGMAGESQKIFLELKLLADVGIIGFPNAGKSTLISRISAARPKVADYPFTTLVPNLGVVKYSDDQSFVVADIPGLIEGAHQGVGLGVKFLRHIERTNLFIHVVDISEMTHREPIEDYEKIINELKQYDEINGEDEAFRPLSDRKQIIALNKVDSVSEERLAEVQKTFADKGLETLSISAVSGHNINPLIYKTGGLLFERSSKRNS